MATLKDPAFIIKTMHDKKIRFYRVYDADKKQIDFYQESDGTVEEAAAKMEETLSQLDGLVHIMLSLKSDKEKGEGAQLRNTNLNYSIVLGRSENAGKSVGIVGHTSADLQSAIEAAVEKAREKWELEERLKKLEAELAEAKEGNPMINQAIGALLPILAQGLGPVPPAAALAGFSETEQADRQQRLTLAIRTLAKHDQQYLEHLEKIAEIAEHKPLVYAAAIGKLKAY